MIRKYIIYADTYESENNLCILSIEEGECIQDAVDAFKAKKEFYQEQMLKVIGCVFKVVEVTRRVDVYGALPNLHCPECGRTMERNYEAEKAFDPIDGLNEIWQCRPCGVKPVKRDYYQTWFYNRERNELAWYGSG